MGKLELYNREKKKKGVTSVTAMDPRELGRGQVESGNPKMKSRRERAGQMVVVVVVVERETLL